MQEELKPDAALRAIEHVQDLRETLTTNASALLWMVWGLVLPLTFYASFLVEPDGTSVARIELAHTVSFVNMVAVVVAGTVLTHRIWTAHALEVDATVPWWRILVGTTLVLALALVAAVGLPELMQAMGRPLQAYRAEFLLSPAAAATLTVLQRRRIPLASGTVATLVLAAIWIATFVPVGDAFVEDWILPLSTLVVFFAKGLWDARRP